jgi:hypothetical protein
MSEKYPGFFTAIFGGRKAKEPEPVKPKKKPKKKVVVETVKEKPSSDKIQRREEILARLRNRKSDENE